VAGQCVNDACANRGTCDPGQYCDLNSGDCLPNPCAALQCSAGQRCVPTLGICKPDPCLDIQCPAPCWSCDITPDGVGTCALDFSNSVCQVQRVTAGTQGGGCACAVNGDAGSGGPGAAAALAFALAAALGWRRRRARPADRR
jgi:MYXO-CTERM domain-containing protein